MDSGSTVGPADIGAAMLTWYAAALRELPGGLVTQAQAATMLAVNRMAVSRLVARGHLRAVYFPRPPDVAGVAAGRDEPKWVRLAERLGIDPATDIGPLPKACYVSFADVVSLWRAAPAQRALRRSWQEALMEAGLTEAAADLEPAAAEDEPEAWML